MKTVEQPSNSPRYSKQYLAGERLPHYPMPATMMTAILSCIHQDANKVWSVELAKRELRRSLDNTFVSTR